MPPRQGLRLPQSQGCKHHWWARALQFKAHLANLVAGSSSHATGIASARQLARLPRLVATGQKTGLPAVLQVFGWLEEGISIPAYVKQTEFIAKSTACAGAAGISSYIFDSNNHHP